MAEEGLQHAVAESWQCCSCLKGIREEKDRFSLDCGVTLCSKCLLQCEVIKAEVTCGGCCSETKQRQQHPTAKVASCLPKEISIEDILSSPSQGRRVIEQALGAFSLFLVESGLIFQDLHQIDQIFGLLVSELLNTHYGPLLKGMPGKMVEKWDRLAMAQTEVVRAAHGCILWNCCGFGPKGKNYEGEEWVKLLMKAVRERDRALQALLDSMMGSKKSKGDRSLMKVIRRSRAMAIRKCRRSEVQKKQCGWQQEVCPYPTQPTATGWAGNLTEGI